MAADTNGFDYEVAGEPLQVVRGNVSTTGFDYEVAGEPMQVLVPAAAPTGNRRRRALIVMGG